MGGSKPRVVHYDASVDSAKHYRRAMEFGDAAQNEANDVQAQAIEQSRLAADRVRAGLSLLGDSLKDRNLVVSNQLPITTGLTEKNSQTFAKSLGAFASLNKPGVFNKSLMGGGE